MDLVVHAPGLAEPLMVDLTVVSALTQDALALGSARRDGAAAAAAARRKRARYPGVAVVPFVVEDHGRLGEEALALTRLLAPAQDTARSAAIRRLHQSLGCVLQRNAADAVLAATQAQGWAAGARRGNPGEG